MSEVCSLDCPVYQVSNTVLPATQTLKVLPIKVADGSGTPMDDAQDNYGQVSIETPPEDTRKSCLINRGTMDKMLNFNALSMDGQVGILIARSSMMIVLFILWKV